MLLQSPLMRSGDHPRQKNYDDDDDDEDDNDEDDDHDEEDDVLLANLPGTAHQV